MPGVHSAPRACVSLRRAGRVACTVLLVLCASAASAGQPVFEYPVMILDVHDADDSCWRGMDADGNWHGPDLQAGVLVVPEVWLVGPPPSSVSAVTIPEDHWIHLAFSGRIADGNGADIIIEESGKMGEQALVFLTDGQEQEYAAALAVVENTDRQESTRIEIDLAENPVPFVTRGIRIVGIDLGGGSPGFDLANVQARISHECGKQAGYPNPLSGAAGIDPDVQLRWTPGCSAGAHRIYFSAVESEVRSGSPEALYPPQPHDADTFQPPDLEVGRTYYWRVDEVDQTDANEIYAGDVWSFTVWDHLVVDDFEGYVDGPSIEEAWQPIGLGGVRLDQTASCVCQNSMVLDYYCAYSLPSAALHVFDEPQDWRRGGIRTLQLTLRDGPFGLGDSQLYVVLTDGENAQLIPYSGPADPNADWDTWRIDLRDFNGIDLTRVRAMVVGVGSTSFLSGESHTSSVSITDISLYPELCLHGGLAADLNGDCAVDCGDVQRMAADWLNTQVHTYPVAEPNDPVLRYTFDGHTDDSAGTRHGQGQGRLSYEPGVHGQAIHFANPDDAVIVPDAANLFAGMTGAVTIAFWQYGDDSSHLNDTICCSNYEYGKSNPAISINLGCWEDPGRYRWDCGYPWSPDNRVAGIHRDRREWTGRWNHWVFTKDIHATSDGQTGRMQMYLNGALYDERYGTDSPITGVASFEIGSGWYGRYDGLIDDFEIYDYALSPAEVAWLASDGTGVVEDAVSSPADLDNSGRVDLHDFALLATQWLEDNLWP